MEWSQVLHKEPSRKLQSNTGAETLEQIRLSLV